MGFLERRRKRKAEKEFGEERIGAIDEDSEEEVDEELERSGRGLLGAAGRALDAAEDAFFIEEEDPEDVPDLNDVM